MSFFFREAEMPYLALHSAHVTLAAHVTFAARVTFAAHVTFASRVTSAACSWSLSLPSISNLTRTKHPLRRAK